MKESEKLEARIRERVEQAAERRKAIAQKRARLSNQERAKLNNLRRVGGVDPRDQKLQWWWDLRDKPGIYAFGDGYAVKVGIAKNFLWRLQALRSANPRELFVVGLIVEPGLEERKHLESLLHAHLDPFRIRGEWFRVDHLTVCEAFHWVCSDSVMPPPFARRPRIPDLCARDEWEKRVLAREMRLRFVPDEVA